MVLITLKSRPGAKKEPTPSAFSRCKTVDSLMGLPVFVVKDNICIRAIEDAEEMQLNSRFIVE